MDEGSWDPLPSWTKRHSAFTGPKTVGGGSGRLCPGLARVCPRREQGEGQAGTPRMERRALTSEKQDAEPASGALRGGVWVWGGRWRGDRW